MSIRERLRKFKDPLYPGLEIRDSAAFRDAMKGVSAEERSYYQTSFFEEGDKASEGDLEILHEMALHGACYHYRDTQDSGFEKIIYVIPFRRTKTGAIDHRRIFQNLMNWVEDALEPDTGFDTRYKDRKSVKWWTELHRKGFVRPGHPYNPAQSGGRTSQGYWYCIDHATLASALLRHLGYPVREANFLVAEPGFGSTSRGKAVPYIKSLRQTAALEVWHDGTWRFLDPYFRTMDPKQTMMALAPELPKGQTKDWLIYGRYAGKTHQKNYRVSYSPARGIAPPEGWDRIGHGKVKRRRDEGAEIVWHEFVEEGR